jgi:hypothetical protein
VPSSAPLRRAPAAAVLALAALAGCRTTAESGENKPKSCAERFAACAPRVHYTAVTDASRLDLWAAVHVSLRLDVRDRLARDCAARALRVAETADLQGLLELDSAYQDAAAVLDRCKCEGERTAWEKQGVGAVLARRLPPAELRSPKTWEDRIVAQLASARDLSRQAAQRSLSGIPASDLEARQRAADAELCRTVHGARSHLVPAAYRATIEAVLQRRLADEGSGSAETGRAAILAQEQAATCPPAGGAPR